MTQDEIGQIVSTAATIASALFPAQAAIINTVVKVSGGVIAGVESAVTAYNQIKSGAKPTPEQIEQAAKDSAAVFAEVDAAADAVIAKG